MRGGQEGTTESKHRKKDTNMHTYRERDRQRNNRIARELHELRGQSLVTVLVLSRSQLLNTTS